MNEAPPPIPPGDHLPAPTGNGLVRLVIGGTILGISAVLFFFSPETHRFYPRCLLYVLTGLQCPACGGLRAAHHLLHGNISTAFHYNALVVLLPPFGLLWAVAPAFKRRTGRLWLDFTRGRAALISVLTVALIYGVLRNLVR
jgi:predicted small integral membrane protein